MEGKITIGKDTFSYENNGKFIKITAYSHADGVLIFKEESDGRSYFHIHIPETIDGLPVLVVDKLWLNVDYAHHYRHNGYDVVKIHLPENTGFCGLQNVRIDMYSVFVPNFSEEYYPRQIALLKADNGAVRFFGEKTVENTCRVFLITNSIAPKKDWVWSKTVKDEPYEKMVVPSAIDGYPVKEICSDSTYMLPESIKEIYIEEGIEEIGDNCFSNLPFLTNVYLPKSIKHIGAEAFGYYKSSRYEKYTRCVPTMYVHYCDNMPLVGENAFHRHADKEQYDDYADWGEMYTGSIHFECEVVFQKNE